MDGAQLKRRQGTHAAVTIDEARGVSVSVLADAQILTAFDEAQSAFGVGSVVGPPAVSAGLVGQIEGFDSVFDSVGTVECAPNTGVVLGLALAVSLGDVASCRARLALSGGCVGLHPFDTVHEGAFGAYGLVLAAFRLCGHVHGAFCLRAGLIPLHHVQVGHERPAQVHVVSGHHWRGEGDDDAHAGLVGGGRVGRVDDTQVT